MTARKIYRSREDRWIAGVCGGLAEYLDVDPILIRVLWIVLAVVSFGTAVLLYILLWIFVEEKPQQNPH